LTILITGGLAIPYENARGRVVSDLREAQERNVLGYMQENRLTFIMMSAIYFNYKSS